MENPATWGKAERVISKALDEHDELMHEPDEIVCGLSLPRKITDALREAGLLKEDNQ